MHTIKLILFLVLLTFGIHLRAQDCTLGIGGRDTQVIIDVFQLNEEQQRQMGEWIEALKTENGPLEEQARNLFQNHPQNTSEELARLADKYRVIKDQMVENSRTYDRKLLNIFNRRQYERYIELCMEARRTPIPLDPPSGEQN